MRSTSPRKCSRVLGPLVDRGKASLQLAVEAKGDQRSSSLAPPWAVAIPPQSLCHDSRLCPVFASARSTAPTNLETSLHEIEVTTVSPEEASHGVAELWVGGQLIAYTRYDDGDLMS
jgi:hypothetical protein